MDATKRRILEASLKRIGLTEESIQSIWLDPVDTLAPGSGPMHIYLDLNHWINLAKARQRRSDGAEYQDCYEALRTGVASGQLVLPLTATLYEEVTNITQVRQRTDIADVMAELSRFRTIACRANRLRSEFEGALHARFGRPMFPYKLQPFGFGVYFAFEGKDGPLGRLLPENQDVGFPPGVDPAELAELDALLPA